jgi:N-acyl-D-amino-acid deacylase
VNGKLTAVAVVLAAMLAHAQTPAPGPALDLILRHGTVIDGTGGARFQADVGISNGDIARVGDLSGAAAKAELDLAGLYVAPGFINIHSHASPDALATAPNMLTQGVTTEILNPDGGGPLAIADQLAQLAARGLAVNVGAYIGFNSVWTQVVGPADRRPGAGEIDQMRALILDGLSHGAWGVSAGLDYKPAYYAKTDEVVDIVKAAAPWRTNFANHDRLTPESDFSSRAGIGETLAIGERAGLTPVVTHMKVQGHEQGAAAAILDAMRATTARGHYTAADAYPYLAGQTSLAALIIPGWAQDGGRDAMLKRFADPALRARIVREAEQAMDARFGGAKGVYLLQTQRELVDVMREWQVSAGEAVVRLLEQSGQGVILRFGAEPDLEKILKNPTTSIACDCGASLPGPSHPRNSGTFPRVLGHYVRETKLLTWEDAIRKMTGLPASTIGLIDRGLLAPGMAADITVFDPNTIIDHATYEQPTLLSEGVRFVLVNGRVAVRDGAPTGEQGGRALARTGYMPTRPMTAGPRRVLIRGKVEDADVSMDLEQGTTARVAQGTFRMVDPRANVAIDMKEVGVMQAAKDWFSVTGRAKLRMADAERSVTIVIDLADPFANLAPTMTVDAGPAYRLSGGLSTTRLSVSPR